MNKLRLKITGIVVFALVVIIAVYALWPDETQIEQEMTPILKARPDKQYQEADKTYQMALTNKEQIDSRDDTDYIMLVHSCQRIITQYPDSPQAEKARELLQKVPEQYLKLYAEEIKLGLPREPAVRKSRSLRRRVSVTRSRQPTIRIE